MTTPSPTHVLLYVALAGALILGAHQLGGQALAAVTTLLTLAGGYFFQAVKKGLERAEAVEAKTDAQSADIKEIKSSLNGTLDARLSLIEMQVVAVSKDVASHRAEMVEELAAIRRAIEERLPPPAGQD